jgi:hypothetical protein
MIAPDFELKHVVVVFRHGDRSPILPNMGKMINLDDAERKFWADRLSTEAQNTMLEKTATPVPLNKTGRPPKLAPLIGGEWPNGYLTSKGVEQMVEKGRHLRKRYASLLGTKPSVDDVYIRSTNVVRTIRSAQSVLLGMFPEFAEQCAWNIHIHPSSCPLSMGVHMEYHRMSSLLRDRRHESPIHTQDMDIDTLERHVHACIGLEEDEDVQWSFGSMIYVCMSLSFPFLTFDFASARNFCLP